MMAKARRAVLCSLGAIVGAISAACGPSTPPPESPRTSADPSGTHSHEHAHGPLVHRFERADDWAREFDDPARDEWQRPQEVVAAMEIRGGMTVADIGAGTGYFEPWLSRAVGGDGAVLALDVEPDMVRYIGERARREHLDNVRAGLVATDDPKLPPGTVDRILIVDTWHHVSRREAYAAKLRDALKPGGLVVVVDFKLDAKRGPPPQHRLAPEAVVRELTAGGLSARVAPLTLPEQYLVIGTRP